MKLIDGEVNYTYTIKEINTSDLDMINFLYSLGWFEGEDITIINKLADNLVINILDARYSIDSNLASVIDVI